MTVARRVIACVIREGDRFLVCQRPPHKRHGGLWEFPGGKIELGETDEGAARRELREELDLELVRADAPLAEIGDAGAPFTIAFIPVAVRGEPRCLEHSQMAWGTPDELLALPLAPSDRAFVERLIARRRELGGMTVNERLVSAGLLDAFDSAARTRDRGEMLRLLEWVELTPEQSAGTADTMLRNPRHYGY